MKIFWLSIYLKRNIKLEPVKLKNRKENDYLDISQPVPVLGYQQARDIIKKVFQVSRI